MGSDIGQLPPMPQALHPDEHFDPLNFKPSSKFFSGIGDVKGVRVGELVCEMDA